MRQSPSSSHMFFPHRTHQSTWHPLYLDLSSSCEGPALLTGPSLQRFFPSRLVAFLSWIGSFPTCEGFPNHFLAFSPLESRTYIGPFFWLSSPDSSSLFSSVGVISFACWDVPWDYLRPLDHIILLVFSASCCICSFVIHYVPKSTT